MSIRSRSFRITLIMLSVLIVCCSLAALAYAFWPEQGISLQATIAPTLLAPP